MIVKQLKNEISERSLLSVGEGSYAQHAAYGREARQ